MDTRETWSIDPESSTLGFSLRHKLLGQLSGHFECWGGEILFDREDPRRSRVRIWVDLSSIDTGSEERNEYILSTGLFDMRWEPALVFDSEHVDIDDDQHGAVVGSLTLQSIRKQIVVDIEGSVPQRDSSGAWRFMGTARASISRAAFGLRRPRRPGDLLSDEMLGDDIEMAAEIEATPVHSTFREPGYLEARHDAIPADSPPPLMTDLSGTGSSTAFATHQRKPGVRIEDDHFMKLLS
jgi:polyisoprenoid-binding protein YceI